MTTIIEARRLNGTDLGKALGTYGVLQAVDHRMMTMQMPDGELSKAFKVVKIKASAGTFMLPPSAKIAITGVPSPEVKS